MLWLSSSLVHIPQSHVLSHTHTLITSSSSHIHTPVTSSLMHIPNHILIICHTHTLITSSSSHTHTQSHNIILSYTYPIIYPLSYIYPNHILYLSYTYPITYPLIHIPNHISSLIHIPQLHPTHPNHVLANPKYA